MLVLKHCYLLLLVVLPSILPRSIPPHAFAGPLRGTYLVCETLSYAAMKMHDALHNNETSKERARFKMLESVIRCYSVDSDMYEVCIELS